MRTPVFFACVLGVTAMAIQSGRSRGAEYKPGEIIDLPEPSLKGAMSLEEAMTARRSVRHFADAPLDMVQIGQLAWSAQGITEPRRGGRTAPSAGAGYPLEIYVVTADGVFHYVPSGHKLRVLSRDDVRVALSRAALGQEFVASAPVSLIIAAEYERVTRRYGQRGTRYVHIEVGHAGQNVLLQAVALGLASCPVGAFDDAAVAKTLNLPDAHRPLYILPVGKGEQ